ncbi:MAG: hypothetical protein AAF969_00745 [Bacteroidota bacterium]
MTGSILAALTFIGCSGEDGERGPEGPAGASVTGQTGPKGDPGNPGEDKPNVDFYFQDGFKGYTGTQDASIDNYTPNGNLNSNLLNLYFSVNNNPDLVQYAHTVIRFEGISEEISNILVEENENCTDSFHLNQAILYIYISQYNSDALPLYFNLGFYNEDDPIFDEASANWDAANDTDGWDGKGGDSDNWAFGEGELDDYSIQYIAGSGTSSSDPGWFPIPLPRSIVQSWICNPDSNTGMRIRMTGDNALNGAILDIYASENPIEDLRPLLVIETEKIEVGTTTKGYEGTKTQDWDNMSYEEKMAPLHRFQALQ